MQGTSFSSILLVVLFAGLWGCGDEATVTSHGGPVMDYVSLIDNLRASGASVEPAGEVSQPFFSVTGRFVRVNGEDVQVFEYPDQSNAEQDAARVSQDGSSVGAIIVEWIASPHFYKAGRLIVLYVGDSNQVLNPLQTALGAQFAGK